MNKFFIGVIVTNSWLVFALGSAGFAALTAIFGKMGVENVNSNMATFFRTFIIMIVSAIIISINSDWQRIDKFSSRTIIFLVLSGIATGFSWLCYYRALQLGHVAQVASVDKLSVALAIVLAAIFLGESLTWQTAIGGMLIVAGSIVIALPKF
ncbi:MAG: EamA family transporter [Bacteriovorax sp.]|nr:EamA family transporter [Bacteriovorax sp.]